MPFIMGRLATDDERAGELRAKFRRLYGPAYGERVLAFCLKSWTARRWDQAGGGDCGVRGRGRDDIRHRIE